MKNTYLLLQPNLCNVNTIMQNYRVGMKVGCHLRKKKCHVPLHPSLPVFHLAVVLPL